MKIFAYLPVILLWYYFCSLLENFCAKSSSRLRIRVLKSSSSISVSVSVIDWKAEWTSESDWSGSQRTGGNAYGTDDRKTGCDWRIKGAGSDEMG